MSIKLMSAAWDSDLPSTEKMVLLCLCDFANDEGVCWPSMERLARKCSVTDRTVRRAIGSLEERGFLRREKRLHETWICHITMTGQNVQSEGTDFPDGGDTVSPKPSENHHSKKNIAHELPANWEPAPFGEGTKSQKAVDSWPPGAFQERFEHFAAHHRARGNKFKDWQQAWSTWVLNGKKFDGASRQGNSNRNTADLARAKLGLG